MVFSLNTGRLVLEDMNDRDLAAMHGIARDPRVMKYVLIWLENDEQIVRVRAARHRRGRAGRTGTITCLRSGNRQPVTLPGSSFSRFDPGEPTTAEAGYILRPEYWNAGYATEILRALLAFGFGTLSLHRVYAKCDEENRASAHVMEKCGLTYEGTLREHVWLRDHWRSTRYYGMLADEYRARTA